MIIIIEDYGNKIIEGEREEEVCVRLLSASGDAVVYEGLCVLDLFCDDVSLIIFFLSLLYYPQIRTK